jgi:hypothetical protein
MDDVPVVGPVPERVAAGHAVVRRRPRRRWLVLAAVLAVVVCLPVCGVTVWLLRGTVEASRGGKSPSVAAMAVLDGLRPLADEDMGALLSFLCNEHQKELLARLRQMRADLGHSQKTTLEWLSFDESESPDGVVVSVMVQAVMEVTTGGQTLWAHGTAHEWKFETRKQWLGWTVCGIEAPAICGVYIRC